jgi:hypothetical protein
VDKRKAHAADVIPVLVTGIQRQAGSGASGKVDRGDKPRDDTV